MMISKATLLKERNVYRKLLIKVQFLIKVQTRFCSMAGRNRRTYDFAFAKFAQLNSFCSRVLQKFLIVLRINILFVYLPYV